MKKWIVLSLIIVIIEGVLLINNIYRNLKMDELITSEMCVNLIHIRQNVNDTLEMKGECDLVYTSAECAKFLNNIYYYGIRHKKVSATCLSSLIDEYQRLIYQIGVSGYNKEFERKLKNFKRCFALIEIEDISDADNFKKIIKKFNEDVHHDVRGFLDIR